MNLKDYMSEDSIVFLECDNKEDIITELTKTAEKNGIITDGTAFARAVIDRENICSTGIGLGVAIPHAKMREIKDFFIILGILKKEVNWDSIDQKPVKAVFLIGGPASKQTQYLQILAKLTLFIKNIKRREELFSSFDKTKILSLFDK